MKTYAKPYYSVIIPTYNRARLLPFAIKSVLAQTFGDFEIVISNGGSTDNTRDVVQSFSDPRIKYVESSDRLPVGDNYQQGLDNASGEYITFLSDDDAYAPELLHKVKEIIDSEVADIVGYQYCRYYHDQLYEFERNVPANSLLIHDYGGGLTAFSSEEALEQSFVYNGLSDKAADPRFIVPYLSNATYKRSIFDRLRDVRANLFDFVPPDMYLATAVFYMAEKYVCLDMPLLVWSSWAGNATAAATRTQNDIKEHYKHLMKGKRLNHSPLKFALSANCGADCALAAASDLGNSRWQPDWTSYFKMIYENFIFLRSTGVDLVDETAEYERVLAEQPPSVQAAVNRFRNGIAFKAKSFLNLRAPKVAVGLRKMMQHNKAEFSVLSGSDAGFTDVLEAASFVLRSNK
jgi:glycosyltransferase involved in cell wall biosynthesis